MKNLPTVCKYYYDNFGCNLSKGYFVEIGAFNGKSQNSTIILEKAGWDGICVEPIPDNYRKLIKNRNCRCINGAVWNRTGKVNIVDVGTPGWSGIEETHQSWHRENYNNNTFVMEVDCYRFKDLNVKNKINYLQIDTEGSELDILADIDFNVYDIDYICIEDNLSLQGSKEYHNFMVNLNYELVYDYMQDKLYKKINT